ncbi:MAG: hypothetical protein HY078_01095 [Elusimicrobia bacterium]|nr:hypothetical protein [Elusimicrobiota bacterium]
MRNQKALLLEFERGEPVLRLRVANPERFRKVSYAARFRLFKFPHGALLACIIELHDIPGRPFYIHRVHDLSDPEAAKYLKALVGAGRWIVAFDSRGEMPGFKRPLAVPHRVALHALLRDGAAYNAAVGSTDGAAALADFYKRYETCLEETRGGAVEAWDRVDAWLAARRRRLDGAGLMRRFVSRLWGRA